MQSVFILKKFSPWVNIYHDCDKFFKLYKKYTLWVAGTCGPICSPFLNFGPFVKMASSASDLKYDEASKKRFKEYFGQPKPKRGRPRKKKEGVPKKIKQKIPHRPRSDPAQQLT